MSAGQLRGLAEQLETWGRSAPNTVSLWRILGLHGYGS